MSAKFPRGGGGGGQDLFLARSLGFLSLSGVNCVPLTDGVSHAF